MRITVLLVLNIVVCRSLSKDAPTNSHSTPAVATEEPTPPLIDKKMDTPCLEELGKCTKYMYGRDPWWYPHNFEDASLCEMLETCIKERNLLINQDYNSNSLDFTFLVILVVVLLVCNALASDGNQQR